VPELSQKAKFLCSGQLTSLKRTGTNSGQLSLFVAALCEHLETMCNLYSITTNQVAIAALFRVVTAMSETSRLCPASSRIIPRP